MLFILGAIALLLSFCFGQESDLKAMADQAFKAAENYREQILTAQETAKTAVHGRCPGSLFEEKDNSFKACQGTAEQRPYQLEEKAIVFISQSLPPAMLKQLASQALHQKARLVIRGLINNSFKETGNWVKEVGCPVEIDPKAFKMFGVRQVPAFAIPRSQEGQQKGQTTWHLIKGSVTLPYALERAAKE